MIFRLLALICALALAVAVGCGDDDEESTTEATPTKEEFIAEADQICAEGDEEIGQAEQEAFGQGRPTQQEQEDFLTETVLPSIQDQIDGIRGLTPPEGDEQEIAEFLDSAQSALDEIDENPELILQGEEGTPTDPFAETARLGEQYGFQVCAQ
jgi:hypothetical protein